MDPTGPSCISKTATEMTIGDSTYKYMGPGGQEFDTFEELAEANLQYYLPDLAKSPGGGSSRNLNWKGECIIIPLVFGFQNEGHSDWEVNFGQQNETLRGQRKGDNAEYKVFHVVQMLKRDKNLPLPCLIIRNMKLENKKKHLETILGAPKVIFTGEIDFLVLGPRSIALIEVKGGEYEKDTEFSPGEKESYTRLPNSYMKGWRQLKAFENFFLFLQEHKKLILPPRRKILFTPDLDRKKFERWAEWMIDNDKKWKWLPDESNTMKAKNVRALRGLQETVMQIFKQDKTNDSPDDDGKPPFYTKFKDIVNATGNPRITYKYYEKFVPLLVAISSMCVQLADAQVATRLPSSQIESIFSEKRNVDSKTYTVTLDAANISECESMLKQSAALEKQSKKKASNELGVQKVLLLSPDQQQALDGPRRLVIFGPAGSGKTVVLQEKVKNLLDDNEPVTVYAPACYKNRYEAMFKDHHNARNLVVKEWSIEEGANLMLSIFKTGIQNWNNCSELLHHFVKRYPKAMPLLLGHVTNLDAAIDAILNEYITQEVIKTSASELGDRHVIVDDTMEDDHARANAPHLFLFCISLIMHLFKEALPNKNLWIAIDPYQRRQDKDHPLYKALLNSLKQRLITSQETETCSHDRFSVVILRKILRCGETIFRAAYKETEIEWIPEVAPGDEPGHKVLGCECKKIEQHCATRQEAERMLWKIVHDLLKPINEKKQLNNVGIVVATRRDFPQDLAGCPSKNHPDEPIPVREYLLKLCLKSNIQVEVPGESHDRAISMTDKIDQNIVSVQNWHLVSSLEWPLVLFVSCFERRFEDKNLEKINYQRYRGLSRAFAKVIQIRVTYDSAKMTDNQELD